MSKFVGRTREGCIKCGKFVMDLDDARAVARRATTRYADIPTQRNKTAVEEASRRLAEAKKYYDDHMSEHTAEKSRRGDGE